MLQEKSTPRIIENENTLDEADWELLSFQRNDIFAEPGLGLMPKNGAYSEEQSKELAEWARSNDIGTVLKDTIGYREENETTDSRMKLMQLSLMTPRFLYAQDLKKQINDKSLKEELTNGDKYSRKELTKELVEYNEVLREAIRANPSIKASRLAAELQSASIWAGLPDAFRFSGGSMVEQAINGARGEVIMEQLANSEAARLAGITYEATSTEEDMRGVDLRLNIPIQRDGKEIIVRMPIDIKFDIKQLLALFNPGEAIKGYKIRSDGTVVVWPLTSKEDLAGGMMLKPASAEEKSKKIVPILGKAAEEWDNNARRHHRINSTMGRSATRVA